MSMWRCPHCGTPQAEASRCWVCHRSSTTCSTCRHFRRSVAAQLGYCGLDPRRLPLAGTELRGCWEPAAARPNEMPAAQVAAAASTRLTDPSSRLRDFVPVELQRDHRIIVSATDAARAEPDRAEVPAVAGFVSTADPEPLGLTLFGEREG